MIKVQKIPRNNKSIKSGLSGVQVRTGNVCNRVIAAAKLPILNYMPKLLRKPAIYLCQNSVLVIQWPC